MFFGARAPRAALAEITVLNDAPLDPVFDASNLVLLGQAWRVDRAAAVAIAPYAAWTAFATALTAAIAARNPR